MAETNTSFQRLQDIWGEWSIVQGEDATSAQKKALEHLVKWFGTSAQQEPRIAIRSVQSLLLDPTRPDAIKRPAIREVLGAVSEVWTSASIGGSQSLWALQAMILASWPLSKSSRLLDIAALLRSPFELPIRGRSLQEKQLVRWLGLVCSTPSLRATQTPVEFEESDAATTVATNAAAAAKATPDAANFQLATEGLLRYVNAVSDVAESLAAAQGEVIDQQELLFWGQARYCHLRRKPFRSLETETQLWLGAREVADRGLRLPTEPLAGYLVEFIHALGQPIGETRTLEQWMQTLHDVLLRDDSAEPVGQPLSAIASDDATGLPVTFVRLARNRSWDAREAATAVALELDISVDRSQWASWVLRELLLDSRIATANPAP